MLFLGDLIIQKPAAERDRRPTASELDQLRDYWAGNPDQPDEMPMTDLMDFAIASAMRRGEICRLLSGFGFVE